MRKLIFSIIFGILVLGLIGYSQDIQAEEHFSVIIPGSEIIQIAEPSISFDQDLYNQWNPYSIKVYFPAKNENPNEIDAFDSAIWFQEDPNEQLWTPTILLHYVETGENTSFFVNNGDVSDIIGEFQEGTIRAHISIGTDPDIVTYYDYADLEYVSVAELQRRLQEQNEEEEFGKVLEVYVPPFIEFNYNCFKSGVHSVSITLFDYSPEQSFVYVTITNLSYPEEPATEVRLEKDDVRENYFITNLDTRDVPSVNGKQEIQVKYQRPSNPEIELTDTIILLGQGSPTEICSVKDQYKWYEWIPFIASYPNHEQRVEENPRNLDPRNIMGFAIVIHGADMSRPVMWIETVNAFDFADLGFDDLIFTGKVAASYYQPGTYDVGLLEVASASYTVEDRFYNEVYEFVGPTTTFSVSARPAPPSLAGDPTELPTITTDKDSYTLDEGAEIELTFYAANEKIGEEENFKIYLLENCNRIRDCEYLISRSLRETGENTGVFESTIFNWRDEGFLGDRTVTIQLIDSSGYLGEQGAVLVTKTVTLEPSGVEGGEGQRGLQGLEGPVGEPGQEKNKGFRINFWTPQILDISIGEDTVNMSIGIQNLDDTDKVPTLKTTNLDGVVKETFTLPSECLIIGPGWLDCDTSITLDMDRYVVGSYKIVLSSPSRINEDSIVSLEVVNQISTEPTPEPVEEEKVPEWIKNNARWWASGQIGDSDFVSGIQHLIKEKIINIPNLPEQASETAEEKVPDWIRNNAAWWADGLISEDDFVNGIKYLVEQGIIKV